MKMSLYWNNLFCQIDLHAGKQNFRDFQTRVSATPHLIPLLLWSTSGSQLGAWSGSEQERDEVWGSWYSGLKVSKILFTRMQVNLAKEIISVETHLHQINVFKNFRVPI